MRHKKEQALRDIAIMVLLSVLIFLGTAFYKLKNNYNNLEIYSYQVTERMLDYQYKLGICKEK